MNNKNYLIKLIVRECNKTNIQAEQEKADADTTLVQRAISFTGQGYSVTVTAGDAYVLVLLLHHETKAVSLTASGKTYLIDNILQKLTQFEKQYLLLSHSFSGCDTVSAIFGVGKVRFMNMCKKIPADVLQVFIDANSTTEEVKLAGTKIFQWIYSDFPMTSQKHSINYGMKRTILWLQRRKLTPSGYHQQKMPYKSTA